MSEGRIAFCCFLFLFGFSLIFQGVGIFTPHWITINNNGSECSTGLIVHSECVGNMTIDGNGTVMILHVTSFSVLLVAILLLLINTFCCCCCDEDEFGTGICGCIMCFFVILCPATGFTITAACIMTLVNNSVSVLGFSFFSSMAAGCSILLEILCITGLACLCGGRGGESRYGSVLVASSTGFFKIIRKSHRINYQRQ